MSRATPDDVFWILQRFVPALGARRAGYLEGRYAPMFALRDLRKDLGLALDLFGASSASTPLTRSSSELVALAAAATPDLDISAVVLPYRQGRETLREVVARADRQWPLAKGQ